MIPELNTNPWYVNLIGYVVVLVMALLFLAIVGAVLAFFIHLLTTPPGHY